MPKPAILVLLALLSWTQALLGQPEPSTRQQGRPPAIEVGLSLSPLVGLDRILRGLAIELGLDFRDAAFLPSLALRLERDQGVAAWIAEGRLGIGLGPGLEAHGGLLLPLAVPVADSGGGRSLALAPAGIPALFGIRARLGALSLGQQGLRCECLAGFDYRAWRLVEARGAGATTAFRNGDSLAAFALGFTASLDLRLSWSPRGVPRPGP